MKRFAFNAGQIVVLGFLVGNLVGTTLLMLPISSASSEPTDLLSAAFTSVSALSLTGLAVVDTSTHWSVVGQAVIMLSVQIGGLGIMALGSLIAIMFTQKVSFRTKLTITKEQSALGLDDFRHLLVRLFQISVAIELTLALVLTLRFWLGYGENLGEAIWHGLFHAVNAFNNAGFSSYEGGLIKFQSDPIVLSAISIVSIMGALGFPVLIELARRLMKRLRLANKRAETLTRHLSLNAQIVLGFSAILLAAGTLFTAALEWSNPNTLGKLSVLDKILNSFFASAMARTTGFNSIDYGQARTETLLGTDVLMFIGGGSAGTSGGIRITTFAILIYMVIAEIRGDATVNTATRRIAVSTQRTAVGLFMLSVIWIVGFVIALQLVTDFDTDQIVFEALSAFGTCGLSTGITPHLPPIAKVMLMVMMFVGRIGLILAASSLAERRKPRSYTLPKERPLIG